MKNKLFLLELMTFALTFPAISICKWRTVLKWYMRLRREMKIRMFVKIARRSIANLVNIPGRIGHSLDDECLDIATIRRNKYANLLKLSEKSSNKINFGLRISKSLTTLITNDDSHDSNDTNGFNTNDLSVAEKSMRMLGITAEDVMDACARIQERSYWSAQNEITKTPEAMEEAGAIQISLEKDEEETDDVSRKEKKDKEENMKKPVDRILEKKDVARDSQIEKDERKDEREVNDALRSKQTTIDIEKAVDYNLMEEVIIRSFQIEREREEEDNKIDKKEQTLIDKEQDGSLTKSGDVTSDRLDNRVKSTESHKLQEDASSRRRKREEEAERLAKICPLSSVQCKNAKNIEVKPCSSLVRKLETKLHPISTNQKEKWFDQLDRRNSYRMKLTPNGSDKKEHKNSRTSLCACHRALKRNTEKGKLDRSTDINDVKHDRKEFRHFMSIINSQKDKMNGCGSAFKYSEAYRLRKRIQKAEGSSTKQTVAWGSMSLAQTARPSGYARDVVATNKSSGICQKNVQSEACAESIDSRSIYNASLTEKNYAKSEKCETKCPEASDLTLLANKRGVKARRRQDLSPNRKLSSEEREAVELRTLRAFNELTLLEDKKKLEAKRNRDSLNYEQPTRGSEVPGMKVCKPHDDLTLPEEQKEMGTIIRGHDFSSRKRPMQDSSSLKVSKYTSKDKEELKAEEKHDSSKDETSEENVENSRSVSDHLSEVNREEIGILSSEARRGNVNNSLQLNERYTAQAYTSLNLREITRNIEWTVHPRGIVLTNKNLHRQFSENGRRESQQRDIVDDNVASTLHSAFFFKPEIVTRVFRRAQTRIGESLPSFPTFWHEDINMEFVCQVNNEMAMQGNRDSSSFDLDLERIAGRTNFGNPSFPDANGNRVAEEENRDLCIIFIDQEQASHESETTIIEDSAVRPQEQNARSSVETTEATNILLVCILRDFGLEVSEENIHDVTEQNTEEYGDISNVIANFQSSNETSPEEEGDNNRGSTISSHQQILIPNDSCLDDDVASPVNLLQRDNPYNLPDERHTSALDISSEKRTHENNSSLKDVNNNTESQASNSNNNQFDTLVNKSKKSVFNQTPENALQLSSSGSPSFIKEDNFNQSMLRSIDEEELQRLTQLSASEATLKNQGTESIMNLKTTNRDMISQFKAVETLDSLEMIQNDVKNEDENRDIYGKANIFSTHRFSGTNQNERLQQNDSFYSMYERNHDGTKTPISFGDGSLMEEFSNSTIPSSNASARNF